MGVVVVLCKWSTFPNIKSLSSRENYGKPDRGSQWPARFWTGCLRVKIRSFNACVNCFCGFVLKRSRDSSVGKVTRLLAGRFGVGIATGWQDIFFSLFQNLPDRLWRPPTPLFNGYSGCLLKVAGTWSIHSPQSTAEVKNVWSLPLVSLHDFMVWTGRTLSFTFTIVCYRRLYQIKQLSLDIVCAHVYYDTLRLRNVITNDFVLIVF